MIGVGEGGGGGSPIPASPLPPYFPADSSNNPAKTTLHLVSYSSSSNVVSNSERHHNDHVNPKLK